MKLRKRMIALQNIKRHIEKIKSNEVYVEKTLYENLTLIATQIHSQMKFEEQIMSFDFSFSNY